MNLTLTKNLTITVRPNSQPSTLVLQKQSNSLISKIKRVDFSRPKLNILVPKLIPSLSISKEKSLLTPVETPATALIRKHVQNSVARQMNYKRPRNKRDVS